MDKSGSSHIGMVKQSCHLSDAEPCKDTKLSLKAGSFLCRVELLEKICLLIKEKENTTGEEGRQFQGEKRTQVESKACTSVQALYALVRTKSERPSQT